MGSKSHELWRHGKYHQTSKEFDIAISIKYQVDCTTWVLMYFNPGFGNSEITDLQSKIANIIKSDLSKCFHKFRISKFLPLCGAICKTDFFLAYVITKIFNDYTLSKKTI